MSASLVNGHVVTDKSQLLPPPSWRGLSGCRIEVQAESCMATAIGMLGDRARCEMREGTPGPTCPLHRRAFQFSD